MSSTDLFAVPLLPLPLKLSFLLDRLCEHRPWFSDFLWDDPVVRRQAATLRIADAYANGYIWEVYRGPSLVGLLLLDSIVEKTSAQCHFVFFDRTLTDKLALCRDSMAYAFDALDVHSLRVEIPTHVRPLLKFARKLGFRYEAEGRSPSWPKPADDQATFSALTEQQAILGSRRHAAMMFEGQWVDALLLSITRSEFEHGRPEHRETTSDTASVGSVSTLSAN